MKRKDKKKHTQELTVGNVRVYPKTMKPIPNQPKKLFRSWNESLKRIEQKVVNHHTLA